MSAPGPQCRGTQGRAGGWGSLAFLLVIGVASATLSGCTGTAGVPAARAQSERVRDACRPVESGRFSFHSHPWINLHHFLFQWARNLPQRQSGDRRRAVEVSEQAQLGNLENAERRIWERALDYYRERLIAADLLFDRRLISLRDQLVAIACSAAGPDSFGTEYPGAGLRMVLLEAMPVYRRHWWPVHHAANRAWIRGQLDLLKEYEATFAKRLADAYGGEWPSERIRVDAAAYANWAGAYTTNDPDHVTIEGDGYKGLDGLEILFHEVSHASFFEQRVLGQLAAAFRAHGAGPPNRLFHAIQFATPAELLRSLLSAERRDRFRSVAERVNERSRSRDQYRVVLKHWKPFLDGELERAEALDRIAVELAP